MNIEEVEINKAKEHFNKAYITGKDFYRYPYSVTVSDVLDDLGLELDKSDKIRVSQYAADILRFLYDITPLKSKGRVLYSKKTVGCIYKALNDLIPNWKEKVKTKTEKVQENQLKEKQEQEQKQLEIV